MKKVHVVGMVGLASTALGLAAPAAHADTTAPATPRAGDKTVSLPRPVRDLAGPLVGCGYNHVKDATGTSGHLKGQISYSHRCIAGQEAYLNKRQAGLTERVRFYSVNGTRVLQTWRPGTIEAFSTYFISFPSVYAYKVCQALVANSNHNDVKYGPTCETATS
jgi:hypothetical protein